MTYAIIETGGKQIRVEPGRFYDIELLSAEPDETITIESVLLVQHNGEVTIGQPLVAGARVQGTVMRHFRGRKVLVYKMKPKKKTRKKRGHRQEITRLMINTISLNGLVFTSEQAATAETQPSPDSSQAEHQPNQTPAEEQAATAETQPSPDSSQAEHQPNQTPAEEQAATAETQPSPDSSQAEHQPNQTPAEEQAATAETQPSPDSSQAEHQPNQTPAEEQAATAETQPSPDSSQAEHQPNQTPAE